MIVKKGEFDYWIGLLSEAFEFPVDDAHYILFQDDMAYITPGKQGPAELEITRGEEPGPRTMGPTLGPRFRKTAATITVMKEDRSVIFTNAKKKRRSKSE